MRSNVVRVMQFFVTLVVGLAILGSLAVWRLSKGPVSLDFLTPVIESSFAAHELPVAVQVENTTLVWGGWQRVFDLRAVNVRLFGADGKIVALLPEVSIGLSITGLMRGDLAISRLDVFGLRARVRRNVDGRLDFAMPVDAKDRQDSEQAFANVASDLLKSVREGHGLFRYLKRFSVLSAKVRYMDEVSRQTWAMPAADMITVFGPEVIESRFRLVVENSGDRAELAATLLHDRKSARIGGRVDFGALQPAVIARAVPPLSQLSGIRLPVTGSAHFEIASDWHLLGMRLQLASQVGRALIDVRYPAAGDYVRVVARLEDVRLAGLARATPALAALAGLDLPISGQIEGDAAFGEDFKLLHVDLTGGQGAIELPGILPRPVGISGARLRADIRDDQSKITIKELVLDLGGPRLNMTGFAVREGAAYRVTTDGAASTVPMSALDDYWPIGIGATARKWVVANIVDGTVETSRFSIAATVPAGNPMDFRLDDMHGTLKYEGLSVNYLRPMSKVTGISGDATFDRARLDLIVGEGRLRDLVVEHAAINMSGLDGDNEKIAIDVSIRGPAGTLAHVLDEKPLGFLKDLTLSPSAISGRAAFRADFHFPLHRHLKADQVKFAATGTLRDLAINRAPYDIDVKEGDLAVKLDTDGLSTTGSVVLSGVRAAVDWREYFTRNAKERRRLVFSGRVPDMGRPGFRVPALPFLSGPADASVALTQHDGGKGELLVNLELADTTLDLPALGWTKPAGAAGTANVSLSVDAKGLREINKVSVETGTTKLLGFAESFGAERRAWIATIERFENGDSDLQGRVELHPNGSIDADLTGKRFDVAGLVDFYARTASDTTKDESPPRISLRARIRDLRWGKQRQLKESDVLVKYREGEVQGLMLDGRLGGDGALSVRYLPGPDGQILRISSDDFGAILGILPSRSRVTGGALHIRGLRRKPTAPLEGDFYASRFTLSQAPLLARVLQVASLTGIVDALSSKGLAFDAFEGKFAYADGKITVGKASAYGSSIGVSGNGVFDLVKDSATASGTVVPAYSLNRVLGKIPVLGSLLTGGKNEGVFAATYRVEGPIENPKIEVNPLSALAPGFLRNLFGLGADKEPPLPASQ